MHFVMMNKKKKNEQKHTKVRWKMDRRHVYTQCEINERAEKKA